ncbi:hypothetical protein FHW69_002731 [Luteibacter sp. Sphag1AF]|uniref:hypothetical protein n=1 Tax=Luteibacter sp. Sphag1AF TaxID=2587031 RepID=UPI001609AE86|nr:hypothetical protein [Luteibacter sp. Sphag1AF]MBB3228096.1 hypothetical protein [Luteibacter sp. Sphag1AF]
MKTFRSLALTTAFLTCAAGIAPAAMAQVYVDANVNLGPAPECPYGYYDYDPYPCAPYGYYGPEWFISGVFIGAGPWFHGPAGFRGHVDPRFDPRRGYGRPLPPPHSRPMPTERFDRIPNFRGDEWRDGHGGGGRGDEHR